MNVPESILWKADEKKHLLQSFGEKSQQIKYMNIKSVCMKTLS